MSKHRAESNWFTISTLTCISFSHVKLSESKTLLETEGIVFMHLHISSHTVCVLPMFPGRPVTYLFNIHINVSDEPLQGRGEGALWWEMVAQGEWMRGHYHQPFGSFQLKTSGGSQGVLHICLWHSSSPNSSATSPFPTTGLLQELMIWDQSRLMKIGVYLVLKSFVHTANF